MKKIHTTSTSPITYLRILILAFLSLVFVRTIPFLTEQTEIFNFFSNQVVNMGILYAIIVGFLMSLTLRRKKSLNEFVSQELNKIRRIYHLSKHLTKAQPKLKEWFEDVKEALSNYNDLFCSHNFRSYDLGNPLFRKVTYTIYGLPSLKVSYNSELYKSLLDTAAAATESREFIRSKRVQTIGAFQWFVLIVVTITLASILVASTPGDMMSRLVTTAVVFNLFLVLLLIYEYDTPNEKMNRIYAGFYAHNLKDIDPCPPEKKKGVTRLPAGRQVARNAKRVATTKKSKK